MSDYFDHYFSSPHIDSDMELDEAMARHPSAWDGPRRPKTPCPVCGRGMYSPRYLAPVAGGSLPVCASCRTAFTRNNHVEELRRPIR